MKTPTKKSPIRFESTVRFGLTLKSNSVSRRLKNPSKRVLTQIGSSKKSKSNSRKSSSIGSQNPRPDLELTSSGVQNGSGVGGTSSHETQAAQHRPGDKVPPKVRKYGGSAFQIYLQEVGTIPLLSAKEEKELAYLVQQGDEAAREKMIKGNLRLVVKIARDFEGYGVPLLDLINEGNIGLMKAVGKFDPERGAKLSTYSSWWIKQSIKRALANQGRDVRLPIHVQEKLQQIERSVQRLREALGREPGHAEVAAELDLPVHKVACFRDAAQRPASLDAAIQDNDGEINSLDSVIADEEMPSPYEHLDRATTMKLLEDFLHDLKPRELAILQQRFGLADESEDTLEVVGSRFEITREAVRQIQNRALEKLRKRFSEVDLVAAHA